MNSKNNNKIKHIKQIIDSFVKLPNPTYSDYWQAHKKIQKIDYDEDSIAEKQQLKIALLSSFTIDPLQTVLEVDCFQHDLFPHTYIAPFNRFQESVLNTTSKLYQFDPDIMFFFVQLESLLEEEFFTEFARLEEKDVQHEINRVYNQITTLIDTLTQRTNALIVFNNFIVPSFSPLGILDNKRSLGLRRFYKQLNYKLEAYFQDIKQIFLFDLNETASRFGKDELIDYSMNYRGSILFNNEFLPTLSYALMGYIKPLKSKNRKCIVLDLDNTLWGGIIGEDGLEGIKLDVHTPGNEYLDFQRTILSLYNRGIILAVNSKNNEDDALEVFQEHPHMVIQEHQLAAYRINWQDKVQNLIELAQEINIGLDSMVFFDDNPVERARVEESLPEVLVVDMPKNPAYYKKTLQDLNDFNALSLTQEDLTRGEKYYNRRQRKDLEERVQSLEEFIKSLEIVATIKEADNFALPRVTSLINRTNQFNITTRRYTAAEVKEMHKNPEKTIYTLHVEDRFGDEGIVGVALVKKEKSDIWVIDNFMMSCRVIGRKIETAFLYKIMNDAIQSDIKEIKAEYIPTKKNKLVKDFYQEHGFELLDTKEDGTTLWHYTQLDTIKKYPKYLQVEEE